MNRREKAPAAAAVLAVLAALAALAALAGPAAAAEPDPRAVAVADEVMKALGGREAWEATRFLRFDFVVDRDGKTVMSRAHLWDKHTGRYRLEGKTREGDAFVVLMDLNTKDGRAWQGGKALEGEAAAKGLERGYAAWVNDTYWLLMPYKMKDPGVTLALDGEETKGEDTWDKVLLTFDNVGLTPKDRYWAFVNRKTKLVDRWQYVLKGESGPPTVWDWKGWTKKGSILLAPERVSPTEPAKIHFPVLGVLDGVPDEAFSRPETPLPNP